MPDAGAAASSHPSPVLTPHIQVRIVLVLGERLQLLERPPVLDDRRDTHLVGEQPLVRARDEVVEHVLHPAATTQVDESASELQLVVEPGADQKDDEVALNLGNHPPASHIAHARRLFWSSALRTDPKPGSSRWATAPNEFRRRRN